MSERTRGIPVGPTSIAPLASEINALDLGRDRRDLASEVFGAMRAWELISWLARLIAVLNLRKESAR